MYQKKMQSWMKHLDFILLDILSICMAFVAAYVTRFGIKGSGRDDAYTGLILILVLVDFTVLIVNESMKNVLKRGFYREFAQTGKHVLLVVFVLTFLMFTMKVSAVFSRIMVISFIVYYVLISYGIRLAWKKYLRSSKYKGPKSVLYVITAAERAESVLKRYQSIRPARYDIKGICLLDADHTGEEICGVAVDARGDNVLDVLRREWVDEVVVSLPASDDAVRDLLDKLVEMGIVVHVEIESPTRQEWQRMEVERIANAQVLTVGLSMASPMQVFMKRCLDIIGGLVGCCITALLAVIIGPIIYIKSPGPIFFKQTRVGKNGKLFKMYKFRSMYMDAEARKAELMAQNRHSSNLMFKLDYDPRIIGCEKRPDGTIKKGIGNFIRDYSIDEFPQFWNCLKGDISLVGTRPPTVDEWEQYELHHRARLAIKPGITGMWQVSGRSKITDFEQVVELDKKYIREWRFGLDIKLLLLTVKAVLNKEGSM